MAQDLHYLLGQLSMADEMISECEKYRTAYSRKRLKELKAARAEVVGKINKLANTSAIVPLYRS